MFADFLVHPTWCLPRAARLCSCMGASGTDTTAGTDRRSRRAISSTGAPNSLQTSNATPGPNEDCVPKDGVLRRCGSAPCAKALGSAGSRDSWKTNPSGLHGGGLAQGHQEGGHANLRRSRAGSLQRDAPGAFGGRPARRACELRATRPCCHGPGSQVPWPQLGCPGQNPPLNAAPRPPSTNTGSPPLRSARPGRAGSCSSP